MTGDEAPRRDAGWEVPFSDDLLSRMVHHLSSLEIGARLPSERVLAETLGVSRTALRDRLMRLEAIGVVERRSGSGTYLRGLSSPMTGDTLAMGMMANNLDPGSMTPVRVALEREAGRQAAKRGDHINLARMAVALDTMRESADDHGFREADQVFHDALVAASGVPGLQFFGEILRNILTATVREVPLDERDHLHGLHVEIYEAVRDGDPDRAMQAVDGHFDWLDAAIERGTFDKES